jgi:low temperature requirement protein LtrA
VTTEHAQPAEQRVTPLELFFDLVFVFAITRVTSLMAHDLSWTSIGQGLLVLAALWWGWAAYAWLTNHVAGDDFRARLVVFTAMASMVLVALAVPEAFGDHALVFALGYLVMRMAHLGLYWVASREEHAVHVAVARLLPSAIAGPLLLVAAGFADGGLQAVLWLAALAIDYGGPLVTGVAGYRLHPAHFAERFSLIVIIALGESIVAIGVGAGDEALDAAIAAAAVLALIASAGLWWAYFDIVAPFAQRRLGELAGVARNTLARDAFAYLHLPMIAGIELIALGMKKTLGDVDHALKDVPAAALLGGAAADLLAHVAFRLRNVGSVNRARLAAAAAALACLALGVEVEALAALAVACTLIAVLIAYETVRFAAERARLRIGT